MRQYNQFTPPLPGGRRVDQYEPIGPTSPVRWPHFGDTIYFRRGTQPWMEHAVICDYTDTALMLLFANGDEEWQINARTTPHVLVDGTGAVR